MPHRAGYFVLAYSWDHHCQRLLDDLNEKLNHVKKEVSELRSDPAQDIEPLLNYYKKWHYNRELYGLVLSRVKSRQQVIEVLGYRGYGVNRDLLAALSSLTDGAAWLQGTLAELFDRKTAHLAGLVPLSGDLKEGRKSDIVIGELCRKMAMDPNGNIPTPEERSTYGGNSYWETMSQTPWQMNQAIFQKMFLAAGLSSMTIMKGSAGLYDGMSPHRLKALANRGFVEAAHEIFGLLPSWTRIGLDLLKRIHWLLSRGIDPRPGMFRQTDFPDRNGVTFEYGNFLREVGELSAVLEETAHSYHRLDEFIHNLARSYYTLVGVHPFCDGNGRAGKCFINLLLMKKGLPPVVLDDEEELMALPRYGGSVEDMHNYLKRQLQKAEAAYLHEREKMCSLGLEHEQVAEAAFDSGFCFRRIEGRPRKIEVQFNALVIDRQSVLSRSMKDRCRVVVPEVRFLSDLAVYCGFCDAHFAEWRHPFTVKAGLYCKEVAPEKSGVKTYDMGFIAEVPSQVRRGEMFSCSVVAESGRAIFNNRGLNYSYRLEPL